MKIIDHTGKIVKNPTQEQISWAKWRDYKSNKDLWVENEERKAEELKQ